MKIEELVGTYWRAWSEHDLDGLLALLASDFVSRSPLSLGLPADKDALAKSFELFDAAFPDLKEVLVSVVAQGDRVACETVETGTFTGCLVLPGGPAAPTKRRYTLPIASFFRVDARGLIVAQRSYWDLAGWVQQLGFDPRLLAAQQKPPPVFSIAGVKPMTRYRKRMQVGFEGKAGSGVGFTENVSATGMLLHSNFVCAAGTALRGRIQLPSGGEVRFEAEVRWARRAEGALAGLTKSSMGLRFLVPPEERFYQLLAKPAAS